MKRKKVLALMLAGTTVMGSSMSALAATGTGEDTTGTTVTGSGNVSYVDTTVYAVTLPTAAAVTLVVDPQGLAGLEDGSSATAEELDGYAGKVSCTSVPVINNLSSVPMKVSAKLTLTGDATAVTTTAAVNDESNKTDNVLLYAVPSAVDVEGDKDNYVASETGIVLSTTDATVDFILPAATYNFEKDASGTASYALADGELGHGTALSFAGYVNKYADWSAYTGASASKSIGMTAIFTFTKSLADADVADTTAGAPYGMKAYAGTTISVAPADAAPSINDVTYVKGSGALEIPYSLGAGDSAATEITDVVIVVGDSVFSKNGAYDYPTYMGDKFDIQSNKIVIASDFMDYYEPGDSDLYVVYDDDTENAARITITVTE